MLKTNMLGWLPQQNRSPACQLRDNTCITGGDRTAGTHPPAQQSAHRLSLLSSAFTAWHSRLHNYAAYFTRSVPLYSNRKYFN